jgi:hypothetical protein
MSIIVLGLSVWLFVVNIDLFGHDFFLASLESVDITLDAPGCINDGMVLLLLYLVDLVDRVPIPAALLVLTGSGLRLFVLLYIAVAIDEVFLGLPCHLLQPAYLLIDLWRKVQPSTFPVLPEPFQAAILAIKHLLSSLLLLHVHCLPVRLLYYDLDITPLPPLRLYPVNELLIMLGHSVWTICGLFDLPGERLVFFPFGGEFGGLLVMTQTHRWLDVDC